MSDLDLILKILKEEVQLGGGSPVSGQTHIDNIPINTVAPMKTTWESDPNSPSGRKVQVQKREIAEPYRKKYKLNNSTGEVVPYLPEEQYNRKKGAVNPDQNSDYANYQKQVLKKNGPIGSHNKQAMKSRVPLENGHSRTERDIARVKQRQDINNAKASL